MPQSKKMNPFKQRLALLSGSHAGYRRITGDFFVGSSTFSFRKSVNDGRNVDTCEILCAGIPPESLASRAFAVELNINIYFPK